MVTHQIKHSVPITVFLCSFLDHHGAYIVYKQYSKMLDMRLVYMLRVSHHYPTSTRIKPLTAIYTATESLKYLDIG